MERIGRFLTGSADHNARSVAGYYFERSLLLGTLEDGVFRSTDRGEHWSSGNFGLLDLSVNCMVISPEFATDETLFIGTQTGLFCTLNGGRSWREVPCEPDGPCILSLALSPGYGWDRTLLVGTESLGLYRSDDGGLTWSHPGQATINRTGQPDRAGVQFPRSA